MEIQQLRHLLAAIRYGNIGLAAEKTNITQSGLSRSIKTLENSLGLPLLNRSARGVEPTVYGLGLVAHAQSIINERDRAVEELQAIRLAKSGLIKIGVTPNFTHYLVDEVVAHYCKLKPGVDVVIVSGSFGDLVDALRRSEIDLIFGFLGAELVDAVDLKQEAIVSSHSVIVARADNALTRAPNVALADLAGARWATWNVPSLMSIFARAFIEQGLSVPRQVIRTNSVALLFSLVRRLDLLALVPQPLIDQGQVGEGLVEVPFPAPAGSTTAGFVYRADELLLTPALRDLMRLFRERARASA